MLVTVTNPIDNTEIEVELSVQVNLMVVDETKKLSVSAFGSVEI